MFRPTACFFASLVLATVGLTSGVAAYGSANVTGIDLVSSVRVDRTRFDYVYRIHVQNGSPALTNATAHVTSSASATVIVDADVPVGDLAANASVIPNDTFTLRQDRTFPFNPAALQWQVTGTAAPVTAVVPNIVGTAEAAAQQALVAAGLAIGTVQTAFSSTVPLGLVVSQSPAGGTTVALPASVSYVRSLGPQPVMVPNVVGMARAAAEQAIVNAHLSVGTVRTAASDSVPLGSVVSQQPTAGATVTPPAAVDLVVSSGPVMVAVPNVAGATQTQAAEAIATVGLDVGEVTSETSDTVPAGRVISQHPAAGVFVGEHTPVDFILSTGRDTTDQGALLLNEVVFAPAPGEFAFIELKSIGTTAAGLEAFTIANERGETLASVDPMTIPTGEVAVIAFDGGTGIDDTTLHVDRPGFLNDTTGRLELRDSAGNVVDRIGWGRDAASATRLGGFIGDFPVGGSIARAPQSTAIDPLDWTTLAPNEVTRGAANPLAPVVGLVPPPGALVEPGDEGLDLLWYPVPGATQYRVQFASDPSFASLIANEVVTDPALVLANPAPGDYFWRVQAIANDGTVAQFSETHPLSVADPLAGLPVAYALPRSPSTIVDRIDPGARQDGVRCDVCRDRGSLLLVADAPPLEANALQVPQLVDHKDTRMLLLEQPDEHGAHPWNAPHNAVRDFRDRADWTCAAASIAMVNAFYLGHLSQDRINFEVLRGEPPGNGPERDLIYGQGFDADQVTRGLAFALGSATPGRVVSAQLLDALWDLVRFEIDERRPLLLAKPESSSTQGHVFVISGYFTYHGQRQLLVKDPSPARFRSLSLPLSRVAGYAVWTTPPSVTARSDEASLTADSDGDGVLDFDEVNRFHTDPNDRDSDNDEVDDLADIRASVFDDERGYSKGFRGSDGRRIDVDSDDQAMELDKDSDGDGCTDGFEDANQNGVYEPDENETYNFDNQDVGCAFTGSVSATRSLSIEISSDTSTYTNTASESTSATNLVWELNPNHNDAAGHGRHFRLVSGNVSWHHQGVVDVQPHENGSSYPCSGSGSGNIAVGGDEFEAEIVIDDSVSPATITGQGGALQGQYVTYHCADGITFEQPVALPAVYFSTDGAKPIPAAGPNAVPSSITGSAEVRDDQPGVSQVASWHWSFVGRPQ